MVERSVVRDRRQAIVLFVRDRSRSKYYAVVQQDRVLVGSSRLVPLSIRLTGAADWLSLWRRLDVTFLFY